MPDYKEIAKAHTAQLAERGPRFVPQRLEPVDEMRFQQTIRSSPWFKEFVKQYGEEPNLNDMQYDYRAAYQAGVAPTRYAPDQGAYHWPSVTPEGRPLKAPSHPTAWKEYYMRSTGRDPTEE